MSGGAGFLPSTVVNPAEKQKHYCPGPTQPTLVSTADLLDGQDLLKLQKSFGAVTRGEKGGENLHGREYPPIKIYHHVPILYICLIYVNYGVNIFRE